MLFRLLALWICLMATSLHMVGAMKSSITQFWNAQDYFGVSFIRKVCFEYDALGRRTLKETQDTCYRYAWDGNVLLHEWNYNRQDEPRVLTDELGRTSYDREELHTNLVTWVYDGRSYTPVAKLTEEDSYTIVQDYLGTSIQALDSKGEVVWDCLLDIYGDVLALRGERGFVPFRFQGQYEDEETGLYYNRFRYYSPHSGNYISQDPIRLEGNNPTLYAYTHDSNWWIDPWGLDCKPITNINPKDLRWTQRTAGGNGRAKSLRDSMRKNGYQGKPIDVVETIDGLVTVDHMRAAVALELGIEEIPARIHAPTDMLPSSMQGRFGEATTWGEAIAHRASSQRPSLPPTGTSIPPKLPFK